MSHLRLITLNLLDCNLNKNEFCIIVKLFTRDPENFRKTWNKEATMDCLQLTWKKWFLCLEPDFQFSLFSWTIISTLSRQTHSKKVIFMKMKYNFHQQRVNCRKPGAPPSTRHNGYLAGAGATAIKFRKPNWVWSFRPMVFTSFFFAIFSPLRGSSIRYAGVVHEISMNSVLRSFFLGYPQMTWELTVGGGVGCCIIPSFPWLFLFRLLSQNTKRTHHKLLFTSWDSARRRSCRHDAIRVVGKRYSAAVVHRKVLFFISSGPECASSSLYNLINFITERLFVVVNRDNCSDFEASNSCLSEMVLGHCLGSQ